MTQLSHHIELNPQTAPVSSSLPDSPSASLPNSASATPQNAPTTTSTPSLDDLFESIPEGTRIIISGNRVTFENMTPELAQIAEALAGKTS